IVLADEDIPTGFHYVALGHIHKPQFVGQEHIRYSGSIERMDLGEQNDQKGVVLFDLGAEGVQGEFATLPLDATPVYEIEVRHPSEEIPKLRERYPEATDHLVRLRCTYTAGKDNREETLRELEEIFPRWYDRQITESSALGPSLHDGVPARHKSFE